MKTIATVHQHPEELPRLTDDHLTRHGVLVTLDRTARGNHRALAFQARDDQRVLLRGYADILVVASHLQQDAGECCRYERQSIGNYRMLPSGTKLSVEFTQ